MTYIVAPILASSADDRADGCMRVVVAFVKGLGDIDRWEDVRFVESSD
jgi:hypothetical protein